MTCHTRELKKRGLFAKIEPALAAKLFTGTIHFVQAVFKTPSGDVQVPDADLSVAMQYAALAAPPIAAYCSQYGPDGLAVDPSPILFMPTLQGTTYTDADLQSWTAAIAADKALPSSDALVFLNPQGLENTDAPVSQGVLGYHGFNGTNAYAFVNLLGSGLTIADKDQIYAVALSHELAEMTVDPAADDSNPEVCDPCAGNCGLTYFEFFDSSGAWIGGGEVLVADYVFYINSVVASAAVQQCPPSDPASCAYQPPAFTPAPPGPVPAPSPHPCLQHLEDAIAALEKGDVGTTIEDLALAFECLFTGEAKKHAGLVLAKIKEHEAAARAEKEES